MEKTMRTYILIAYGWSWLFWGAAIAFAALFPAKLLLNAAFMAALLSGSVEGSSVLPILLALVAVFGPMIAAFVVRRASNTHFRVFAKIRLKDWIVSISVFAAIAFLPALPALFTEKPVPVNVPNLFVFIPLFFLFQLVTSGTEEFGWRGFLLPAFRKHLTLWQASVKVGFIWAFWHLPIVVFIFVDQGLTLGQILPSLVGFCAGIIASSIYGAWWYERTHSIGFMMIFHALSNTFPMIVGLVIGESMMVSIGAQLLMWVTVLLLDKVDKTAFTATPKVAN